MISNAHASNDGTTLKDTSPRALDRRKTSSSFASSNNRSSFTSTETGESSGAASKRNSYNTNGTTIGAHNSMSDTKQEAEQPAKEERENFKSHRNRASGGFLLSTPASGPPTQAGINGDTTSKSRSSPLDSKSRSLLQNSDRKRTTRRSNVRPGLGASPLATHSSSAANGNGKEIDSRTVTRESLSARPRTTDSQAVPKVQVGGLDVDSAQIVNLALNLSESRRNASRRFVSTPLPQAPGALGDGTVGGSLRQHLQQQRRVSRNISPKPDRGDRTMGIPARSVSVSVSSPLQSVFDTQDSEKYEYNFSASTLARAEKAKVTIELMAQYRRLLHYVPPLKPQSQEKTGQSSDSGGHVDSSSSSIIRRSQSPATNSSAPRPLGRPYNPLQYIRNRKVRSRTSKTIDGESQGFGDLEKVSSWIDTVAQESTSEEYQRADCAMIPRFSKSAEDANSPFGSPQSANSRSQVAQMKAKRPRIDWITNPADMLADIYWAEQDDHKKLLENRSGHPIFPRHMELKRPFSRKTDDESELKKPATPGKVDLKVDTHLPDFKSVKHEPEKLSDWATNKAKQKLKNLPHIHSHNSSSSHSHHRFHSRSRSNTDSSDSEDARESSRQRRSGTADSNDRGKDILEKQMQEMLAREARESGQNGQARESPRIEEEQHEPESHRVVEHPKEVMSDHSRSGSHVARLKRDSENNLSSGRGSLEVPGASRGSFDGLDLRRRSSSMSRTNRIAGVFMGRDRSTSRNRASPTRKPLSRVGSKIRPLYNRAMRHTQTDDEESDYSGSGSKEQTPKAQAVIKRGRSLSPTKKTPSKISDGNESSISNTGSIQKSRAEDSGISRLFKGPRNTVSKVSDFLWKKDSPGGDTVYDSSTDDSDAEDAKKAKRGTTRSRTDTVVSDDMDREAHASGVPSRLMDMPSFTFPFERRGRPAGQNKKDESLSRSLMTKREQADDDRKQVAPRIDVQHASPETPLDTVSNRSRHRESSASAVGPYNARVQYADARLNSILGIPGGRRNALPITGLSRLEASNRRPSVSSDHMGWSMISDISGAGNHYGAPTSKREIARVRALLLSSGIKAKEISRRAAELHDLRSGKSPYEGIAKLVGKEEGALVKVPKSQEHRLAARILSEDIQRSARVCQSSANNFASVTIASILSQIGTLHARVSDGTGGLAQQTRRESDEADEVSKDLIQTQTLAVKIVGDKMERMVRRRRRRFRWVRRGGWVAVEWVLVGVMWGVWGVVMLVRILMAVVGGVGAGVRWLFWL